MTLPTASPLTTPAAAMDASQLAKAPTGILGFDDICGGGLPQARTTLLVGGPGSGRALADGIFMTPTLLRLAPSPLRKIVGTLSDTEMLMQALDLPELGRSGSARA